MKNDMDIRTSNKLKRLKRLKEEKEVRNSGEHRFAEEFSDEPMTKEQLKRDLPEDDI